MFIFLFSLTFAFFEVFILSWIFIFLLSSHCPFPDSVLCGSAVTGRLPPVPQSKHKSMNHMTNCNSASSLLKSSGPT